MTMTLYLFPGFRHDLFQYLLTLLSVFQSYSATFMFPFFLKKNSYKNLVLRHFESAAMLMLPLSQVLPIGPLLPKNRRPIGQLG